MTRGWQCMKCGIVGTSSGEITIHWERSVECQTYRLATVWLNDKAKWQTR